MINIPKKSGTANRATQTRVASHVINQQQETPTRVRSVAKGGLPEIDMSRLNEFTDAKSRFTSTTFGSVLEKIAGQYGDNIEVEFYHQYNAYEIKLGLLRVLYVMGLDNIQSWVFQQARNMSQIQYVAQSGNDLTQYVTSVFPDCAERVYSNELHAVIYEDDVNTQQKLQNIIYFIIKNAFPNSQSNYVIDDDMIINPQNGFAYLDSKTNQYDAEKLKGFFSRNTLHSVKMPGSHYLGMSVFQGMRGSAFGGNFGNGFGGFGGGFTGFGNSGGFGASSFGGFAHSNGSNFGVNQGGNDPVIIGCVRYSIEEGRPATKDIPAMKPIAKIHDVVELANTTVKHVLKYCTLRLIQMGYDVRVELDLSKVSRTICEDIISFFNLGGQYIGEPNFKCLITYYQAQQGTRILPTTFNISTFLYLHKDFEKDPKFPKSLKTMEEKAKFAEYVEKAGYLTVLHPGVTTFIITYNAINGMMDDVNIRNYAARYGMTKEEYIDAFNNGQDQPKQHGGIFGQNNMGGAFGRQNTFGGMMNGQFGMQQMPMQNGMMNGQFGMQQMPMQNGMMNGQFGMQQMPMQNGNPNYVPF